MKLLKQILCALLAITMLLSCSALLAGCQETPSSIELTPEQLLAKVWGKELNEAADALCSLSDRMNSAILNRPEQSSVSVQVSISDIILDNLSGSTGIEDLSFLSDIRLDVLTDTTGEMDKLQMLVSLQGEKLITLNMLANLTQYLFYVGAPELSDTYLEIEAGNLINSLVGAMPTQQQLENMVKALPDKETLTNLLSRYSAIILGYIKNLERSAVTLEAEGISQEATGLSFIFTEKDAIELEKELLTTLKNDAQFKAVFDDFYGAACVDGPESAYNDFQNTVQEKLDALNEQYEYSTHYMVFTTYVDDAENIIGLRFTTEDSPESTLYFYNLTDGTKVATQAALERDGADSYCFSGSGTVTDGKLYGDYSLTVNGVEYLTVSAKDICADSGAINLKVSEEMLSAMGVNTALSLFTVQLSYDHSSFGMSIVNDGKNLLQINVALGDGKELDFDVPENAVNVTDQEKLEQWLSDADTDVLIAKLRELGAGPLLDRIKEIL